LATISRVMAMAAAMAGDHDRTTETAPARLARLYGLTAAEARLAAAMSAGRSLKAYAGEAEISINTARWHLRRVFTKTGTRRQVELVRLLLMNPPTL
jgi:DNA-binding CsgD family transcriptional regulator